MTTAGTRPGGHVLVRAPGKINAFLRVGTPRPDGYHPVASLYLAVSLPEDVEARRGERSAGITVAISDGEGRTSTDVPTDESNLAVRAARLLADHVGKPELTDGLHLSITKRVPVAGGMGGGSADAAAALAACNALWNAGYTGAELMELGARLGADVPFALMGGAAAGLGVGDRLRPVSAPEPFHWVLVPADFGLSTPEVYRALDRLREGDAGGLVEEITDVDAPVLDALASGNPHALAVVLHNDLQAAALALAPGLVDVLDAGRHHGALAGLVSGSGPTIAFLADNATHAEELAGRLTADGLTALPVRGPVPGAAVVH